MSFDHLHLNSKDEACNVLQEKPWTSFERQLFYQWKSQQSIPLMAKLNFVSLNLILFANKNILINYNFKIKYKIK